jgi:hypothetical protein
LTIELADPRPSTEGAIGDLPGCPARKAALSIQLNKTDTNDAYALAQVVHTGWFREIAIKGMSYQAPY